MDQELLKAALALLNGKSSTTVYIFDRSEFYTCYATDAEFVAQKIFGSNAFVKTLKNNDKTVLYVNINKKQFQTVIRSLLFVHQYCIELYKNRNKDWSLFAKASPGNLAEFEDIFDDSNDLESTAVVALKLTSSKTGGKNVAVASCAITNQIFTVAEFPDGLNYTALQSFLVQTSPKEFLLPLNDRGADFKVIEPILRRFGAVTFRKAGEFSHGDIIQDLNRLLAFPGNTQMSAMSLAEIKLTNAMDCVAALISYLKLLNDSAFFNRFKMEPFVFGRFMRLDSNVVRSLEIFEISGSASDSNNTLMGLLNQCRTAAGKRLLDQWVKMPLLDVNKINERLDIVEALINDSEVRTSLNNFLTRFPDVQRIGKSFLKNRATLQDLCKLYQGAKIVPNLISALHKLDGSGQQSIKQVLLTPLEELQNDLAKLIELVSTTLDFENSRGYDVLVKADLDENLSGLGRNMSHLESKINDEANRVASELRLDLGKSLKLEMTSQFGYCLRVTQKDEKSVRNKPGIKILDTRKDGFKFGTASLTTLNEEYNAIKKNYEKVQQQIVDEILKIAATYCDPMQRLSTCVAAMDVLISFATVSRTYVRPEILEKDAGILELRGGRHPCLEANQNFTFIPNDVCCKKGDKEFLLITGPNMGGKSTYLRQTGLIVLMAQIGCFVPCSSARLSVVDAIFTRVGASDAQLEGSSTFRMEMMETAAILEAATSDSLILIDELGRGTSTYDGCALAWSIGEHIATNIRCWCLFATHFHELTALDMEIATVQNLHVTVDIEDGQFTLLYRVEKGPCGSSYGVHIAQVLGLPETVIQDAGDVLNEFAWSDNRIEKSDESSAANFVTRMKRIVKSDSQYPDIESKARAIRTAFNAE